MMSFSSFISQIKKMLIDLIDNLGFYKSRNKIWKHEGIYVQKIVHVTCFLKLLCFFNNNICKTNFFALDKAWMYTYLTFRFKI